MIEKFDADALLSIDLRSLNNGINPYSEADTSLDRAFARGVPFYRDYIQNRVQVSGYGRVLDLMCGFGRWAPFLAECNDEVVGLDILEGCTNIASGLCKQLNLDNARFLTGGVELTKTLSSESFDFIWIWSGLQYAHRGYIFKEAHRLLKENGKLYVGAYNGPGLMLQHVAGGMERATNASDWAMGALIRGEFSNGNPNFLCSKNVPELLGYFGFDTLAACAEGALDQSGVSSYTNEGQERTVLGVESTIEFLVKKKIDYQPAVVVLGKMLGGGSGEGQKAKVLLGENDLVPTKTLFKWLISPGFKSRSVVVEAVLLRCKPEISRLLSATGRFLSNPFGVLAKKIRSIF